MSVDGEFQARFIKSEEKVVGLMHVYRLHQYEVTNLYSIGVNELVKALMESVNTMMDSSTFL